MQGTILLHTSSNHIMESYVHCYKKSEEYITHTIKGNDIQQDLYSSAGVIHVSVYI